jgi:hypothetical protein
MIDVSPLHTARFPLSLDTDGDLVSCWAAPLRRYAGSILGL